MNLEALKAGALIAIIATTTVVTITSIILWMAGSM